MIERDLFEWLAIFAPEPPPWWVEENKHGYSRAVESGKTEMDRLAMLCDWKWTYANAMMSRRQIKSDLVREIMNKDGNTYERVAPKRKKK